MRRSALTHLVAAVLGATGATGAVALAANDGPAAHRAASNAAIVNAIQTTNRKLDTLNRSIGGGTTFAASPDVGSLLQEICENTRQPGRIC